MGRDIEQQPPVSRRRMDTLRYSTGEVALVVFTQRGRENTRCGRIREVRPFSNIELAERPFDGTVGIPFMGYDTAILRVEAPPGNVVFVNPTVDTTYRVLDDEAMYAARKKAYGNSIATSLRPRKRS